jgi:hypothetical protein
MRELLKGASIFFAGSALGVVATLGVHKFMAGIDEDISRQIPQIIPSWKVTSLATRFCRDHDRPPKDSEELVHFAMREATNELDLGKFSVLRFEPISNRTAIVVWQLAPPAQGGGTNTISWEYNDRNAQQH